MTDDLTLNYLAIEAKMTPNEFFNIHCHEYKECDGCPFDDLHSRLHRKPDGDKHAIYMAYLMEKNKTVAIRGTGA